MSTSTFYDLRPNEPTSTNTEVFTAKIPIDKNFEDLNGGIQLDPIGCCPDSVTKDTCSKDEIVPLAKPEVSGRLTSSSVTSESVKSEKRHSRVTIGMPTDDSDSPDAFKTPRHDSNLSGQISTFLRRGSSLSVQDSWRKKFSSIRVKSSKNFVSFHNIYYTIPQGYFWRHKPAKVILNNVR